MRKTILASLAIAWLALPAAGADKTTKATKAARAAKAAETEKLRITHGPYLEAPRDTSVTVVWFTNKKCLSWIMYGMGKELDSRAVGIHHGLIDANETRHVVQIDNLRPGATYRYYVISREITEFGGAHLKFGDKVASEVFSFTALDAKKRAFSFCDVSDIHEQAADLNQMLQHTDWRGVDLMFLDGDMVNKLERPEQAFDAFLDVCVQRFARNIPFVWVRGNHEDRGPAARHMMEIVPVPEDRFYYSFNHGGVHFIVLDSGEDKEDTHVEYTRLVAFDPYREVQAKWLKTDLESPAARRATYRVAVFHIATHGGGEHHGAQETRRLWTPLLNAGGVDLLIGGHIHQSTHVPPAAGANHYDVVTTSTHAVLRAEVTATRISVRLLEDGSHVSVAFDVLPRRRLRSGGQ